MLSVYLLSKSYGPLHVLEGLSAAFNSGDVNVIMGSSGSGKSTFLKILAGIENPTSGHFTVDEARTSIISYVPQGDSLVPWLCAEDNVLMALRVGRARRRITTEQREHAKALLTLFGLSEFTGARPYELSGGMKQRVALARSLVAGPSMILLDEPFSALDDPIRIRIEDEIRALVRKCGMICVLVTHSLDQAIGIGDAVWLLEGSPARIKQVFAVPPSKRPLSALDYGVAREALLSQIRG